MTAMDPRIPAGSRVDRPATRSRRSPPARRLQVEQLEARTVLSSGPVLGLPAMGAYSPEMAPTLIGVVQSVWTAQEAGAAVPATVSGADARPAGADAAISGATDLRLFAEAYASLLAQDQELLAGLAGTIVVIGQAYRNGVSISMILEDTAAASGTTPAQIPLAVIPLGVAAASSAQQAGVALPATVSESGATTADIQVETWISSAVGEIKAQESSGDSAVVGAGFNAASPPPFLISLGDYFLGNIDSIYDDSLKIFESAPVSMGPRSDGNGLDAVAESTAATDQESPEFESPGAGGTSSAAAGESGAVVSRVPASRNDKLRTADGEFDELVPVGDSQDPVPPASITAGELPLDILLSDPELSTRDVSVGLESMAELIPLDESSLAMVATLWTVPSESRPDPPEESDSSDAQAQAVTSSAVPVAAAMVVIGQDEMFERIRDAYETTLSDGRQARRGDSATDLVDTALESRCPLLPTVEGTPEPERAERSSRGVGTAAIALSTRSPGNRNRRSQDGFSAAKDVGGLPEWAVRSVCAASAATSALVIGWFCARRRRRRRRGLPEAGRTNARPQGTEISREERP